jgi:hypothetical protein
VLEPFCTDPYEDCSAERNQQLGTRVEKQTAADCQSVKQYYLRRNFFLQIHTEKPTESELGKEIQDSWFELRTMAKPPSGTDSERANGKTSQVVLKLVASSCFLQAEGDQKRQ